MEVFIPVLVQEVFTGKGTYQQRLKGLIGTELREQRKESIPRGRTACGKDALLQKKLREGQCGAGAGEQEKS